MEPQSSRDSFFEVSEFRLISAPRRHSTPKLMQPLANPTLEWVARRRLAPRSPALPPPGRNFQTVRARNLYRASVAATPTASLSRSDNAVPGLSPAPC